MAFASEDDHLDSKRTPSPTSLMKRGGSSCWAPRKKANIQEKGLRGVQTAVPLGTGGKGNGGDADDPKAEPCLCCGFSPGSHY